MMTTNLQTRSLADAERARHVSRISGCRMRPQMMVSFDSPNAISYYRSMFIQRVVCTGSDILAAEA